MLFEPSEESSSFDTGSISCLNYPPPAGFTVKIIGYIWCALKPKYTWAFWGIIEPTQRYENSSQTIILPTPAEIIVAMRVGSIRPSYFLQICKLSFVWCSWKHDSSYYMTNFQPSTVQSFFSFEHWRRMHFFKAGRRGFRKDHRLP